MIFGVSGPLAKMFGLTPKQFARNLDYNSCVEDVEQHPEEPLKTAEAFVSKYVGGAGEGGRGGRD